MGLDETDFLILKCLEDQDQPMWKKRIHEYQSPLLTEEVSVQTVGRRVDKMMEDGYLDSCIISPEEIKRDLIIAFKLTEKGEEALQEKRQEILQSAVREHLFPGESAEDNLDLSKQPLIELMSDEFGFDAETKQELEASYSKHELITFLGLHYVNSHAEDVFDGGDPDKLDVLSPHLTANHPFFNENEPQERDRLEPS